MDLYPRSFLQLVVLSHVLVLLPLLVAIGWVSWSLNDLVSTDLDAIRGRIDMLRGQLLGAEAMALAAAGAFLLLGRRVTSQLWNRFERAVHLLGAGQFDRHIRLKGPDDMRRVGRRLEWLRSRLLALEEQRTLLFRHVSHELKTPLATLREGAGLLREEAAGALTPQQRKIAGIMHNNALRLQTLIENLLKLQQAGFVRDRVEVESVRMDELIRGVLETHQLATRGKHLHISGTVAPLLRVEGGREELLTIVNNLFGNAVKYSPDHGTIRISAGTMGDFASIDIVDSGPGVPVEDREKIFEPFYRGHGSRGVSGVGLGLAIAHQFALAHGGNLTLLEDSAPDVGAHFRVMLPLKWVDRG